MPLSESTSSVALSAAWWSKTMVSEKRSSKAIVVYLLLVSRSSSTKWRRIFTFTPPTSLTTLEKGLSYPLLSAAEHRRGDHDQFLALEGRAITAAGHQGAAHDCQGRGHRASGPIKASAELTACRREDERAVNEIRRVMALQRFDQHRPPRDDRQLDALGLALADDRERQFAVPGRFLNQILKLERRYSLIFTMPTLSISASPILVITSQFFRG